MSNTAHLKKKKCDMCDNLIKVNDALARGKENPLNNCVLLVTKKTSKQTSVSNKLEITINSEMFVEVIKKRRRKKEY